MHGTLCSFGVNIYTGWLLIEKKSIFFLIWQIDHSVVESFAAGGKTNILSRVYPELAVQKDAHLFVFNNGTEPITIENLRAWSMKPAKRY